VGPDRYPEETGYFFTGAAAGAAAGAAFFASAADFAAASADFSAASADFSAFAAAFFAAFAAYTAYPDDANPTAYFTTTLSPTLKESIFTFSPAFRSTFPFFPFTVKVPAAISSASIVPLTCWPFAALADFFADVADFSAEVADFSAEVADFSAAVADFSAAFAGFAALSAATAKPATENANATAITTVKIFFISVPSQREYLDAWQGIIQGRCQPFRQIQPTEIIQVVIGDPRRAPRRPPHWRQAFPIWGIDQEGRIPNFFSR
jgi:hypothetical protein